MILEKLKTLYWFGKKTKFYPHAVALIIRKFLPNRDAPKLRTSATEWAQERAVPLSTVLPELYPSADHVVEQVPLSILSEAEKLAAKSQVKMGGAGAMNFIYTVARYLKPACVIETGVAYGWSSLAFLAAMSENSDNRLISVDMPYVKTGNEPWVGVVVPDRFRKNWTLIREPDRNGLKKAIKLAGGPVDICHYDSDKSYWGRRWAYPLLWESLRPGGLFISDDIQDNFAFREFVEENGGHFFIIESEKKFVGIIKKK